MAEKITEEQVAKLQDLLRSDASTDLKVQHINNIKSGIKQNNVPEACIIPLFEAVRASMTSQHAVVIQPGFSTLNNLLARLARQDSSKYVVKEAGRTLPLVIEKLGDPKEKYRALAATCLTTFWKSAPVDVEKTIKNTGLVGKNSRMKEASMHWLVQMHQEHAMPFKSFVTTLMDLLEDADGMVRDTARNSVISLFQNAPNGAKSDLKKQLKNFNVRPAIVAAITAHLGPNGPPDVVEPEQDIPARPHLANSVSSTSSMRPSTPVTEAKVERVDPAYVNTLRELDETLKEMHPFFEGKESEANWLKREQSCTKLRRLNAGNAPSDYHDAFLVGIKSLLDGILKAVNSLRTSLSKEGCSVVQEIARTAGPGLDPMVEILLQNLIKLCGGTKKISSQNGNLTVDIIISKVSFNLRIVQHIWLACQDKNVQPRTYATGWLKTLLKKESHHKSHLEHSGGLDLIEKCIKKGLADPNPGVRENMRSTFWAFAQIWPSKAEAIMASLDATQQRLLENSPDNPNSPKKPETTTVRPGLGFSKSTTGPPKPSLRETMLAQKKAAMANKNLPPRPGSAMSSFSPVRNVSTSSSSSSMSEAPVRSRPESSTVAHGGLSVAPVRPTRFRPAPRPELVARPATAGPYSVRRPGHAPSSSDSNASPTNLRAAKIRAPSASSTSSPKRVPARPTTSHSNHTSHSHSSHTSPAKSIGGRAPSRAAQSPRVSPPKPKPRLVSSKTVGSSPAREDENFSMVVPMVTAPGEPAASKSSQPVDSSDEEEKATPLKPLQVYEDPFSSTDDHTTPRPLLTAPVLEEVPVNDDASNIMRNGANDESTKPTLMSPERLKQSLRLVDSGIAKIKAKSLDVHGFRKLQVVIRDNKAAWTDDKFDVLLLGLFEYLESSLTNLTTEKKALDVKAQILATIKLLFKKERAAFRPHLERGLESILSTRSSYDSRTHIVSGLELLADELVTLAEPRKTLGAITARLQNEEMTIEGCRTLSMGLHVLKELLEVKKEFIPTDEDVVTMCRLASRCIDSSESGVRLDAVNLCVAIHAGVGEARFWGPMGGIKDDSKSLITYYIVKRQRELATPR
ncbi:ARM repeat-containing protein [Glarea lozoyensis ATCC 20868]|uniref:ARM repeat-containing protein n=1 Tax=Glarea lozoyensis (strain ATCC 20868 / MF5171) TaxID=1116229 RepID=S3D1C8_GLAL2|nr:ARM repeat-containing protein [Glarea lozoyensis ATCC 20868]EPE25811.1 ARM repeat-containing protein [Glarea lozoyensis ATCC 20868]